MSKIKITYNVNEQESFKRAVLAALCLAEGDFEQLPEIVKTKLDQRLRTELRADLGVLAGKINQNLQNGNKK